MGSRCCSVPTETTCLKKRKKRNISDTVNTTCNQYSTLRCYFSSPTLIIVLGSSTCHDINISKSCIILFICTHQQFIVTGLMMWKILPPECRTAFNSPTITLLTKSAGESSICNVVAKHVHMSTSTFRTLNHFFIQDDAIYSDEGEHITPHQGCVNSLWISWNVDSLSLMMSELSLAWTFAVSRPVSRNNWKCFSTSFPQLS